MNRVTTAFVTIVFWVAVLIPSASALLPIDPAEIENRRLVLPEISIQNLMSPTFYRDALIYVRDANPVRAWLIKTGSSLDLSVFHDSPQPQRVLLGEEDWLYGRKSIEGLCQGSPETAASNLISLAEELALGGTTVVFTVAPAKFVVHPEHLTEQQARLAKCGLETSSRLRNMLAANAPAGSVDSWILFESVKREGAVPYFQTDSHFNHEGAMPWIEMLVSEIAPHIWDSDAVVDVGITTKVGNLMGILGLAIPEESRELLVDRGLPRTPAIQKHQRFSQSHSATEQFLAPSGTQAPLISGKAVMLKDSFMDLPAPSLSQYFADLTIMDWRDPVSIQFFLEQAHEADVVLIEVSEESILSRFVDDAVLRALREAG